MGIDSRNIFLRVVDRQGRSYKDIPPHQIDFYRLNFPNIMVKEYTSDILEIVDKSGANLKGLRLWDLYLGYLNFHSSGKITTPAASSGYIELQSFNGGAYVTNIKLVGGHVEIREGWLMTHLSAMGHNIYNIGMVEGQVGDKNFYILARRTAAYAGDALFLQSYNASDVATDRLIVTGGVDEADIKIVNAKLDFNDQSLEASAGSLQGYFRIKVGGVEYKVPAYALS